MDRGVAARGAQGVSPKPGEARTAAEANAEQQRDRDAKVTEIDSYAVALGVRPPHAVAELVEFMVACGVLIARVDDNETRYELNPQAALPGEVLPLSTQRRATEDELRWLELNEPVAQKIIGLFKANSENPLETLQTSLQRLARSLGVNVDTARAGLAVLLRDPDFSANRDVEQVAEHAIITISVDWDVFAENRIGISAGPRDDN